MFGRYFGPLVALAGECSPDKLLGMVWATFSRRRLTGPGHVLTMFWPLSGVGQGLSSRHPFGDGLGQVSAERAGPCFVNVSASGWRWPGNALQTCFWGWFGLRFPGVGRPGRAMFCRCSGLWVALARKCSPDILVGIVWATFPRCRLTQPGNVLSMYWPLGAVVRGMLFRHAFGDGLGDFSQVSAHWAGQCFVDVLASGWLWTGSALQTYFC